LNIPNEIQERPIVLGRYIVEHNATVRSCAKVFGVSKSTVHKDVTQNLMVLQPALCEDVKRVLNKNKSERHIRGGMATKLKYQKLKTVNK
jgi:putative DeoR family transcriptional regulator (stage III sporulation protein D)